VPVRREDGNGERRISAYVSPGAALALDRLAKSYGITKWEMLERLVIGAEDKLLDGMKSESSEWESISPNNSTAEQGRANAWWNMVNFPLRSRKEGMADCLLLRNGGRRNRLPCSRAQPWITWLPILSCGQTSSRCPVTHSLPTIFAYSLMYRSGHYLFLK
jgi:hypothetical protein